ncbi:MAG TPA: glycosyl transferase, partial [Cyanobacteria bacterium UBA11371]|nr:glycosyl transferase [Cyanobacteria bacterium UBA11371]
MLANLFRGRVFKFLLGGGLAALVNLILIHWMIDRLGFNTPVLRNVANVIAIEISLLLSFFIYRIWVWPGGAWTVREVLLKQLPLYHFSAGAAVITRIFVIFPVLDWLRVNYAINTLIGVVVSASINYLISDRLVFKAPSKTSNYQNSELYYPEGLEPALANSSDLQRRYSRDKIRSHSLNSGQIKLLSVVIPAYNEEGSIVETIHSISKLLEEHNIDYEILVVNDNSCDRTEEILQQLNYENSKVRYINNYYPNGFGFAVRCGLENFQGDAVAIMMADNSDDPQNLVDYYY